jgi:hypothetical protein
VANTCDPVQALAQEALVVLRARHSHLDQIVILPGYKVCLNHLRNLRQGAPERLKRFLVVAVEGQGKRMKFRSLARA